MRNQRGFTLIELIIVMVILGIMAALAIPKFFSMSEDAKYSAVQGGVGGVRSAIANYYAKEAARTGTGTYPTLAQVWDNTAKTSAVLDGVMPDNPYCDGVDGDTCNTDKKKLVASTVARGTAGCAAIADTTAAWCYNATTGEFWAGTDDANTTITGRIKENTM